MKNEHWGAMALLDQGTVSITSFVTALLIGRACGRAELGIYTLAWTLLSVCSELSGALITTPYTVFRPRISCGRQRRYLGSMLVQQIAIAATASILICLVLSASLTAGLVVRRTAMQFSAVAAALIVCCIKEFARRVSFAHLKMGRAFATDMIASVLQLAGMLVMWWQGILNVASTLSMMALSSASAAGWWMWASRREIRLERRLFYFHLAGNWQFSRWVLGSGFLSSVARYLFPWMLAAYHGSSATGIWASCTSLVAVGNPVVIGLSNYALPRISTVYAQAGRTAMQKKVTFFSAVLALSLLPVVLALSFLGDGLVARVFGPAFTGTSVILSLLAWNLLVNSITNPYSQGLFTLNRAKEDTIFNGAWVAMLFTVGTFAVRSYSVTGAAAALLAGSILTALARSVYFWNAYEPPASSVRRIGSANPSSGRRAAFSPAERVRVVPETAQIK